MAGAFKDCDDAGIDAFCTEIKDVIPFASEECYIGLQKEVPTSTGTAHVLFLNPFVAEAAIIEPTGDQLAATLMRLCDIKVKSPGISLRPMEAGSSLLEQPRGAIFKFGADGAAGNGSRLQAFGLLMLCCLEWKKSGQTVPEDSGYPGFWLFDGRIRR